jgi:hypothetical protein
MRILCDGISRHARTVRTGRMNKMDTEILQSLERHGVPFVIIGGHAVNYHGHVRATEDVDVVWLRSSDSEQKLFDALNEMNAQYFGKEIDPATGVERTYPVTLSYIRATHIMILFSRLGFLDLFDHIPGLLDEDAEKLFSSSVESNGLRYASLGWLRRMKEASGRTQDKMDLENLPTVEEKKEGPSGI